MVSKRLKTHYLRSHDQFSKIGFSSLFIFSKRAYNIEHFFDYLDRHQVMYPLQFTRLLGLVDVECIVDAGGNSSQAGAIRYALSMCLRSYVDNDTIEQMKVCGLLTQDVRVRERKKPGKEGARRRFHWRKR